MPCVLSPNRDQLTVVMPVQAAEQAVDCILSFMADCGIPADEDGPLTAALNALWAALSTVPRLSVSLDVGTCEVTL